MNFVPTACSTKLTFIPHSIVLVHYRTRRIHHRDRWPHRSRRPLSSRWQTSRYLPTFKKFLPRSNNALKRMQTFYRVQMSTCVRYRLYHEIWIILGDKSSEFTIGYFMQCRIVLDVHLIYTNILIVLRNLTKLTFQNSAFLFKRDK